jgi:arylsulfate sulfotransferase
MLLRAALALLAGVFPLAAQMSVSLSPSTNLPVPLGTPVTWTATAQGANSGNLEYRFRIRRAGGDFQTVVDFGPKTALNWTTISAEGIYEIEAAVRNIDTGEEAADLESFTLLPLATGDSPVITPTANPLVYIYSAPGCAAGSRMGVMFTPAGGGPAQITPFKPCTPATTMNFYLAGMTGGTPYVVQHRISRAGTILRGPSLTVSTNALRQIQQRRPDGLGSVVIGPPLLTSESPVEPPTVAMLTPQSTSSLPGILLQSLLNQSPIATDLAGNIVWYGPGDISFLTRPAGNGLFLGIGEDGTLDRSQQFVREFDLAGITQVETNAARVNEQLAAFGVQPINSFHHEAARLPNGNFLVLANSERILTAVQAPGPVDVIGDTILVLDPNMQVLWAWDAFDHLDPHRTATMAETCTYPAGLACAPFYLSSIANDWLHGNALQLTPDGNILYSVRHQDWVVKIDYHNGLGTGDILWRLGQSGDFQIASTDPYPWFSHQHDPHFEPDGKTLLVFDNGNIRAENDPNAHSRGQVLSIDETSRTASLVLNADMGVNSIAVGSAQSLPNRNYHFDSGFVLDPSTGNSFAQSVEVDPTGKLVFGIQFGAIEYRSFRMRDLYTLP